MATIPSRESTLGDCVASIINQVDHLHVYLNGHRQTPSCLAHPRITAYLSMAHHGDLGDVGKFFRVEGQQGLYLSLDDDFKYPADYVSRLAAELHRYGSDYCVGVHGIQLHARVKSYCCDRSVFHWNSNLAADQPVHILGTGLLCFDASKLNVALKDFGSRNMADLWFGLLAQRERWGLVCIHHKRSWLRSIANSNTLFDQMRVDDSKQTALVKRIAAWKLWAASPRDSIGSLSACPDRCVSRDVPIQYRCVNPSVFIRDGIVSREICESCTVRRS